MDPNGTADLAFVNGRVYTMDAARRWSGAVAVSEGRIVAVGTDADVRELIGPGTEVVDLGGRMLLPGFQDAHVHAAASGLEMLHCNLSEAYSVREYERIVLRTRRRIPTTRGSSGAGGRWTCSRAATRRRTSSIESSPTDRCFLMSRDGHSAWVNSRALEIAGRDARHARPGRTGGSSATRTGEPAGTLHEGAIVFVERHVPEPRAVGLDRRAPRRADATCTALGITAWQDAIVGGSDPTFDAYRVGRRARGS